MLYKKNSTDTVLETINTENQITVNPLSLENVGFGVPLPVTTPGALQNARVRVYALREQGYSGNVDIEYQRLSLAHMFQGVTVLVQHDKPTLLSDLLPKLNAAYGLNLVKDDIVDQNVSALGEDFVVTLTTRPTCLMWSDTVDLRCVKSRPAITAVVTNAALDIVKTGFTPGDRPRAEYVTWGYDFSEIVDMLDGYTNKPANQALADAINGVVNIKAVYNSGTAVANDEINIYGGTCRWLSQGAVRYLDITLPATSNYAGSLQLRASR